jgi:hypothetical protein
MVGMTTIYLNKLEKQHLKQKETVISDSFSRLKIIVEVQITISSSLHQQGTVLMQCCLIKKSKSSVRNTV